MRLGLGLGLTAARGAAASPPAAWAPTDLAGLSLWTEARGADLWQDTGKTTPATANTNPVRVQVARFPAATDLTAPSDAARPTLSTAGLGGEPALSFDGAAFHLRGTIPGVTGAQTVALRFQRTFGGRVYSSIDATGLGHEISIASATQFQIKCGADGSATASILATVPSMGTTPHTLVMTWDGANNAVTGSYGLRLDGVAATLSTGGGLTRPDTTPRTTVGARSSSTASLFFTGFIAVVVVVAGVVTGDDLAELEAYLDAWT